LITSTILNVCGPILTDEKRMMPGNPTVLVKVFLNLTMITSTIVTVPLRSGHVFDARSRNFIAKASQSAHSGGPANWEMFELARGYIPM
jgi:hypothetical protein